MANLIFDKAQIESTIDKIVDRTMRMDMTLDWPCGVAYYGICEAYEVTKNERYLQLVKDRVDEYIELGQSHVISIRIVRSTIFRSCSRFGPAELDGQHLLDGALPDHPV